MAKLFTLKSGSIKRRTVIDDAGTVAKKHFDHPYTFVPSPSEYQANKFRLIPAGEVSDDSAENRDAFLNTNLQDNPNIKAPKTAKGIVKAVAPVEDNISHVHETPAALALITSTVDASVLDKFQAQELGNQKRVRKAILEAIIARKTELTKDTVAASE